MIRKRVSSAYLHVGDGSGNVYNDLCSLGSKSSFISTNPSLFTKAHTFHIFASTMANTKDVVVSLGTHTWNPEDVKVDKMIETMRKHGIKVLDTARIYVS